MAGIGDIAKGIEGKLEAKLGKGKLVISYQTEGPADKDGKATTKDNPVHLTDIVKDVDDVTLDLMVAGEVVSRQSFGNFRLVPRKATKARNPQTGAQFDVPACNRPKCTFSKTARARVNAPKAAPTT